MEENIRENESAAATGEKEIGHSPAARNKHRVRNLIRDMWPAYLIEIFVIILGISISLALEQWRDNNKESRLENIYLTNLLSDIEVDIKSLDNVSVGTKKILNSGNLLMGWIRNPENKQISYTLVDSNVRAILGRPKFFSSDATFSDLKSSGNVHLLKDIKLKNLLFSYYSQTQNIKELQDAEQQATITISGNYFLKRISLDEKGDSFAPPNVKQISDLIRDVEFSNNVLLRVSTRNELLEMFQIADSLALKVRYELIQATGSL